mmetsp:Transcript_11910/g.18004  ORF Transcript_11910/g.18004 Transcript_11910/m.18004 type:complete len:89 (-) Transcript_11910:1512-1778(-)
MLYYNHDHDFVVFLGLYKNSSRVVVEEVTSITSEVCFLAKVPGRLLTGGLLYPELLIGADIPPEENWSGSPLVRTGGRLLLREEVPAA